MNGKQCVEEKLSVDGMYALITLPVDNWAILIKVGTI